MAVTVNGIKVNDAADIRAVTMYGMVREVKVNDKPFRVLHATHRQVSLMTSRAANLASLADEFCKHPPKVVVDLLPSLDLTKDALASTNMGAEDGKRQLETFMQRVLMPIAEEAGALVICDARKRHCLLTAAFMKAYKMRCPAWGSDVRVTVLGFAVRPEGRENDKLPHHWQHLLAGLKDQSVSDKPSPPDAHDLDTGIPNLILIDTGKNDDEPYLQAASTKLRSELMSHFNAITPCISSRQAVLHHNEVMPLA